MSSLPKVSQAALRALESQFFEEIGRDRLGAGVSVWSGETEILCLSGGFRDRARTHAWTADTLVPIWSCTKGLAAAATLSALEEAGLNLDTPVVSFWEAFGQGGKEALTVGDVLSHRAGLAALTDPPPVDAYGEVIRALEREAPQWQEGHGYHPRTMGFLMDEIVRRLTGARSLGDYWREALAEPLGVDAWIGLPRQEHARVAELVPGRLGAMSAEEATFYAAFGDPESLTARAFGSPRGLHAVAAMNAPSAWMAGYPAFGGVASARGLAAFYGILAQGGRCAGQAFFSEASLAAMETTRSQGADRVLLRPTAFAAGFMKDTEGPGGAKMRELPLFGPHLRAFGHPGAGGSLAFADPEQGIGFAYVMNQMERSVFPTEKVLRLVRCLYS